MLAKQFRINYLPSKRTNIDAAVWKCHFGAPMFIMGCFAPHFISSKASMEMLPTDKASRLRSPYNPTNIFPLSISDHFQQMTNATFNY
jgi:hypothetical protein